MITTTINIHGANLVAKGHGDSVWVEVPVANNPALLITAYLDPAEARTLGLRLIELANSVDRRTSDQKAADTQL